MGIRSTTIAILPIYNSQPISKKKNEKDTRKEERRVENGRRIKKESRCCGPYASKEIRP
ncbi:hypothetical protein LguiA_012246 [Lonicera macranthoides]